MDNDQYINTIRISLIMETLSRKRNHTTWIFENNPHNKHTYSYNKYSGNGKNNQDIKSNIRTINQFIKLAKNETIKNFNIHIYNSNIHKNTEKFIQRILYVDVVKGCNFIRHKKHYLFSKHYFYKTFQEIESILLPEPIKLYPYLAIMQTNDTTRYPDRYMVMTCHSPEFEIIQGLKKNILYDKNHFQSPTFCSMRPFGETEFYCRFPIILSQNTHQNKENQKYHYIPFLNNDEDLLTEFKKSINGLKNIENMTEHNALQNIKHFKTEILPAIQTQGITMRDKMIKASHDYNTPLALEEKLFKNIEHLRVHAPIKTFKDII